MNDRLPVLGVDSEPCGATEGEVAQLSAGMTGERVAAQFTAELASIGGARRFVNAQLADRNVELVDDAVLMVSELATNCIRHAHSPFTVSLISHGQAICVEVADQGFGSPARQFPDPYSISGRGLQLVDQMSDTWGVTPQEGVGKTVWFTIAPQAPR